MLRLVGNISATQDFHMKKHFFFFYSWKPHKMFYITKLFDTINFLDIITTWNYDVREIKERR